MGLLCVLGQYSNSAWSSSPPRFTTIHRTAFNCYFIQGRRNSHLVEHKCLVLHSPTLCFKTIRNALYAKTSQKLDIWERMSCSSNVQFLWACRFLFWSSAAVAKLPQGDAFQYSAFIKSGYSSYCSLPVSLSMSNEFSYQQSISTHVTDTQ